LSFSDRHKLPPAEMAVTQELVERISKEIECSGGWIRFDRFMQRALYEPGLGYYSGGATKLGQAGDFVTGPELSNLLADALAGFFEPLLAQMETPCLLELGAGTGRLAARIIDGLSARGLSHLHYMILEPSADLRERQQSLLRRYGRQVTWLDTLPSDPIEAIIFGNEVADALPVAVFVKSGGLALPLGVVTEGGRLQWQLGSRDEQIETVVAEIESTLDAPLPDGYRSEVCLSLPSWLQTLAGRIKRGGLLLIDYGVPRRDYYHVDRSEGTLICHFRHVAHNDPFAVLGLQDITAWVDFSACAAAATTAGMHLEGFTTQAQFLLESLAIRGAEALATLSAAEQSAAKTLILPGEMGERFKLLWLVRGLQHCSLPGRDFRAWL
jgi:SAM-dependent MidA family methyltransferase